MYFNSIDFGIFFLIVISLYHVLPHRGQNRMLLAASYFFYGYWDWRFLSLIFVSTLCDFIAGLKIGTPSEGDAAGGALRKRRWLQLSIFVNLGLLGVFKYFNFFIGSLDLALGKMGFDAPHLHLNIVLPVGISFYTFQTMSYTADIYRQRMKPSRDFFDFALFVSFFPQLVAGPIERAVKLLPQISLERRFDLTQFIEGLHLICWGLFKKVFVADNLAPLVDRVFSAASPTGLEVVAAVYAFAFQIYCDFSGYSNIARGLAKCMGIELMRNFDHPYLATNPREFWQRWHISLSTWLRDYLYIPLGGNRSGNLATNRNLLVTMLLGGLWHGAAWNFVLWGAYHGFLLIAHRLVAPFAAVTSGRSPILSGLRRFLKVLFFFQWTAYGWLLFRAQSMSQIATMSRGLLIWGGKWDFLPYRSLLGYSAPVLLVETSQYLLGREKLHDTTRLPIEVKSVVYAGLVYLFLFFGAGAQSFIYFQF